MRGRPVSEFDAGKAISIIAHLEEEPCRAGRLIQINDGCWCAPQWCEVWGVISPVVIGGRTVDKDRIVGSAKQVKGAVKEVVGKAVGDTKLESEGKADKIEGKVQNVIGGLKDTLKGK